jgi:hypothetical protein
MLLFIAADTHAGPLRQIGRGLGKKIGQKIVDDVRKDNAKWKQERRKVQRETCKLFKDLLIRKKILRQDLDIIEDFIDSRLPRDWMPRQWYRSDLERIGFKLIDPSLTIVDYEYLKDLFNRIWNTHPNRPWWEIIWNRFGEYGRRNYYRPPLPGGIAL